MLVDMRCPKCGGNSTQYDERKWRCLHCSNYFLYEPIEAPKTTVQHFVNISGDAQYDLDVSGATNARPLYDTVEDGWPNAIAELKYVNVVIAVYRGPLSENRNKMWGYVIGTIVSGGAAVVAMSNASLLALLVSGFLTCLFGSRWTEYVEKVQIAEKMVGEHEQKKAELLSTKNAKLIGYRPLCPYCRAEAEASNKTLTHCLKCGKRFYYAEPTSFPIKVI